MSLAQTTDLERTSLEAHVDLCAMRYMNLESRLENLETKVDALQKEVVEGQKSLKITIITSATSIVAGLLAVIVTILMKF